jgi:hypothetical protein
MLIMDILNNAQTTNSDELNRLSSELLGESFIGVYPADHIPDLVHNGQCLIFNNQDSDQRGEHWLGLYNFCGKEYAFDTFNRNIKELNKNFKNKKWITPSHKRLESIYDKDCGQQVIAWLCTVREFGVKEFFDAFQ